MRMMLGILAVLGLLVIGFGVALAAGWVRFGSVDPFANIKVNPATQPAGGVTPETPEEPIPEPPPLVDKTVLLRPEDGRLSGHAKLTEYTQTSYGRLERKVTVTQVVTGLYAPDDAVDWMLRVSKPGKYTVTFDYAGSGTYSRKGSETMGGYELRAGDKVLTGDLKSTRGTRSFELVDMGTIELPEGEVRITLRPTSKTSLSLMSLRGIRLFPPD